MRSITNIIIAASILITSVAGAAEIQVLKASSSVANRLHETTQKFDIMVVAENLGSDKNITLLVKRNDGSWKEFAGTYKYTISASQQAWAISGENPFGVTQQSLVFAVKYTVNGKTYIDDNKGTFYTVPQNGEFVNNELMSTFAELTQAKLQLSSVTMSLPKYFDTQL